MTEITIHNQSDFGIDINSIPEWVNYIALSPKGESGSRKWIGFQIQPEQADGYVSYYPSVEIKCNISNNLVEWENSLLKVIRDVELIKAINVINNFSSSTLSEITSACEMILFKKSPKKDLLSAIKYIIKKFALNTKSRAREKVYMRFYLMTMLKNDDSMTLAEIGRLFGKDHATVLHALKKHKIMMLQQNKKQYLSEIQPLLKDLKGFSVIQNYKT